MNKEKIKRLALRFSRIFVTTALATMATVVPIFRYTSDTTWTDFGMWLGSLALAGLIGGISGVLATIDKSRRV